MFTTTHTTLSRRIGMMILATGLFAATTQATEQAAAIAVPANLLALDSSGQARAAFGHGWQVSTDAVAGGSSSAQITSAEQALLIQGEVRQGAMMPWGGAMFYPGKHPFAPQDLGAADALRFKARGDGKRYALMFYSKPNATSPAFANFASNAQWQEHVIPFAQLKNFSPQQATAIGFVSFGKPGQFKLEIKEVELIKLAQ